MDVISDSVRTEAARQYAAAHAAQYTAKDLYQALVLHRDVMATHPNTEEAMLSLTQIQNIVRGVVPQSVLLEDQIGLALAYLENEQLLDVEPAPVMSRASELTG
jgi:hypothetical protein